MQQMYQPNQQDAGMAKKYQDLLSQKQNLNRELGTIKFKL